uniref:Uncharacterized protein n=1 Tax=Anopheles funestus TaxID=62324 RepID=A0A4Y0BIH3_ANOFN
MPLQCTCSDRIRGSVPRCKPLHWSPPDRDPPKQRDVSFLLGWADNHSLRNRNHPKTPTSSESTHRRAIHDRTAWVRRNTATTHVMNLTSSKASCPFLRYTSCSNAPQMERTVHRNSNHSQKRSHRRSYTHTERETCCTHKPASPKESQPCKTHKHTSRTYRTNVEGFRDGTACIPP